MKQNTNKSFNNTNTNVNCKKISGVKILKPAMKGDIKVKLKRSQDQPC